MALTNDRLVDADIDIAQLAATVFRLKPFTRKVGKGQVCFPPPGSSASVGCGRHPGGIEIGENHQTSCSLHRLDTNVADTRAFFLPLKLELLNGKTPVCLHYESVGNRTAAGMRSSRTGRARSQHRVPAWTGHRLDLSRPDR